MVGDNQWTSASCHLSSMAVLWYTCTHTYTHGLKKEDKAVGEDLVFNLHYGQSLQQRNKKIKGEWDLS